MNAIHGLIPAFGVGFLFTLGGSGERIAFAPKAGSSLSKSYTIGGEFELDEISLIVDGQDMSGVIGQIEVGMTTETRIEVTDSYKAVDGGRPTEFLRTFDALSSKMLMEMTPAQDNMPEIASSSELEGKTVAFRWNAEKAEYELSFHETSGDEELLEGLVEDMDLRVLLPTSEVDVDDTWSIQLSELQCIAAPGGNLRLLPEGVDVDEESLKMFEKLFGGLESEFGELLEGECVCTFKGTRDEGGARVAEIAVEIEVAAALDLSEFLGEAIRTALEQNDVGEMVAFTLDTADFNLDFEGEGTLLWNLGAARVHSFQLSGDATMGIDIRVSVEAEGETHNLDASVELSGSLHEEVAVEE